MLGGEIACAVFMEQIVTDDSAIRYNAVCKRYFFRKRRRPRKNGRALHFFASNLYIPLPQQDKTVTRLGICTDSICSGSHAGLRTQHCPYSS